MGAQAWTINSRQVIEDGGPGRAPGAAGRRRPLVASLQVRYLPYGELAQNRQAMARFGEGLRAIEVEQPATGTPRSNAGQRSAVVMAVTL